MKNKLVNVIDVYDSYDTLMANPLMAKKIFEKVGETIMKKKPKKPKY